MKQRFYPTVPKDSLIAQGYIAERSGHSRGSTVDLTIMPAGGPLPPPSAARCDRPALMLYPNGALDMGTRYDCFSPRSETSSGAVSAEARAHRLLLVALMAAEGFRNYPREWWHFTLRDEPFPATYFDEPIE